MDHRTIAQYLRCSCGRSGTFRAHKEELLCESCKMRLPVIKNKIFFTEYSGEWPKEKENATDPRKWSLLRKRNFEFFDQALNSVSSKARILDLGTGQEQFRELFDRYERVGIDFVPYERADVVANFNEGIPFADGVFDGVVASNVLEHLPDGMKTVREIFRILKSGGISIVTVPFLLRTHQEPYDFNRYTNFMLEKMFREAGFVDIRIEPLGAPVEVFDTTKQHFFMQLFDATEKENRAVRLWVKFLWNAEKLIGRLGRGVYANVAPSLGYTLGYGVVAQKL